MAFHPKIEGAEGRQIIAWHLVGLSPRDMRDDMMTAEGYPHPRRSLDGIIGYLRACGYEPIPSQRGPKIDGRDTHCDSDRHPGESVQRRGPNNECQKCKTLRARERRGEVREGLVERVATLRAMGGEAEQIADWIEEHVRVA